jgi:cell division protein FtsB
MAYLGIALTLALFTCGYLFLLVDSLKNQIDNLAKLNSKIEDELTSYKSKNSSLWSQIKELSSISEETKKELEDLLSKQEKFEFQIGSKVSWVDKTGEIEFGIVYDDFNTSDNHLVVVRGIKKNKLTGRYFTVSLDKITVVNE